MKKWILLTAVTFLPFTLMAQDDDMYFVPTKENVAKEAEQYGIPKNTYYSGSKRSIDDYNRRSWSSAVPIDSAGTDIIDFSAVKGVYPDSAYSEGADNDYKYTREMTRFDGYTSTSAAYWEGYRDGRWASPWYYSSYYYPWYDPWYDPWYYGYYSYYSPWRYGWYGSYYRPWGYYGWYTPRYYYGGRVHYRVSRSRLHAIHNPSTRTVGNTFTNVRRTSSFRNGSSNNTRFNNSNSPFSNSSRSSSFGGSRNSIGGGGGRSGGGGFSGGGGRSGGGGFRHGR